MLDPKGRFKTPQEPEQQLETRVTESKVMTITVELIGEETRELEPDASTYGDLLAPFGLSEHEVSVLVDGQPVPEDAPIDKTVSRIQIIRLIKGG